MGNTVSFAIERWSAWAPGIENKVAWTDWAQKEQELPSEEGEPNVKDLPAGIRRRLSRLGKMAIRVALDSGSAETAKIVFSSRNGNVVQMLKLLQSLAVDEPISPTGFGMSVHNSLVGMLSIITGNKQAQTAIAADSESLCMGLMEALALLNTDPSTPVLLVHCDEFLPDFYQPFQDKSVPVCALALVLRSVEHAEEALTFSYSGQKDLEERQDPLKSFLRFLIKNEKNWSWSGVQGNWLCERHA
ncbi:MAG: beta-ketoacyl synthase chain length factor [Proteobacteria bacterium]|nr:beta-ketoacyl synthase chain length factor [Pseudomonadota bacterium]